MQIHCIDKQKADQLESDVFVSHAVLLAIDLFCPCSFANETAPCYFFKTEKYILPKVFEPVQLKLMGPKQHGTLLTFIWIQKQVLPCK